MYLIAWMILLTGVLGGRELLAQPAPPLHLHAHREPVPMPVMAQGGAAVIKVDPIRQKTPSRTLRRPLATRIPASVTPGIHRPGPLTQNKSRQTVAV